MGNGNNWGGARPGAGRKRKPLAERLQTGQVASAIVFPVEPNIPSMPEVRQYLNDDQRMGNLYAKEIYEETWQWLADRGCVHLINPHVIERYSMAMGRWVQCEKLISELSPIAKKSNGEVKANPLVEVSQNYLRESRTIWNEIWYIVQANCTDTVSGNPQDDMMERLLSNS